MRVFVSIALASFAAAPASAGEPGSIEPFTRTSWTQSEGLDSTLILALAQTPDGYLWLGTSDGLIRFDGLAFEHRKLFAGTQPVLGTVTALHTGNNGALWVGAGSDTILRVTAGSSQSYKLGAEIEAIVEPAPGAIWAVTGAGLYRFAYNTGRLVVTSIVTEGQLETLLAVNGRGVVLASDGISNGEQANEQQRVQSVAIGGHSFLLGKNKNGQISLVRARSTEERGKLLYLRDSRNYLWEAIGEAGLSRTRAAMQAPGVVNTLLEDREGNIWAGTNTGLLRFRYSKMASLTMKQGLSSDEVTAVDAHGKAVWIGGRQGLDRFDDFGVVHGLPGTAITALKVLRNGMILASTQSGVFQSSAKDMLHPKLVSKSAQVIAIEEDSEGCLWLLEQSSGLNRMCGSKSEAIDAALRPGDTIIVLRAFADGSVWAGLSSGRVIVFRNNAFHDFAMPAEAAGIIYDIAQGSDESVWLATDRGLYCSNGNKTASWNTDKGLPGNRVLWLVPDGPRALWLGFATGVAKLDTSKLDRILSFDFYGFDEGLIANPLRVSQRPAIKDAADRLWFTTSAGMAVIDTRHIPINRVPPSVFIRDLVADHRAIALKPNLQLPPLTKNLDVEFAGLSLSAPRGVKFQYRLDGYDKQWQDAGNRRQAFYTNLDPGAYRFRVVAANSDSVWNPHEQRFAFQIQAALYQTNPFKILCLVAAVLLAWSLYQLRLRRMKAALDARFEERLAERTRIAQDLHDQLLQNALGVSLQIELVDSLVDQPPTAKAHLQRALVLSREMMAKGREVLRGLRDEIGEPSDLPAEIAGCLSRLQEGRTPAVALIVDGTPRAINSNFVNDLAQIACEAAGNALQHAAATGIEVHLLYGTKELRLEIRDNGNGMDSQYLTAGRVGHYGLLGMRERAHRIGAAFSIMSQPGAGTAVRVVMKGKRSYRAVRQLD